MRRCATKGSNSLGSHAVYVRWQRGCVEALGAIVVEAERELGARVESVCAMFEEAVRKFRDDEALRVEALLERARREGEADRRRIERMIEAGSNALAMAHRASENAGVASAHAQQLVDEGVAGIFARVRRRLWKEPLDGSASNRKRGIVFTHAKWRHGWGLACWRCSLPAPPRCNGGLRRKARRAKPCSKRSTVVGFSR